MINLGFIATFYIYIYTYIYIQIENILNRRTVNLSDIQLTQSETNLLRKRLNFCPTPPPPGKYDISKDIDAFARRLTLKEYHTPENIEDVIDGPGYQPSILQKLNQKERKVYTRPQGNHTLIHILTNKARNQ